MDATGIAGVILTPLKIVPHPKGDVLHALKRSDNVFHGFGEAYFSSVIFGEIKGWKKHARMTLNLIVPVGEIKFVLYDDRHGSRTRGNYLEECLSAQNYKRLTVPPGIWMGFQGMGKDRNILLNIADLEYDPAESENKELPLIAYDWILQFKNK